MCTYIRYLSVSRRVAQKLYFAILRDKDGRQSIFENEVCNEVVLSIEVKYASRGLSAIAEL